MLDDVARARPVHHLAPQVGIGGMHRDVQRCQLLLVEPLPVVLFQVGQRDEIAKKERIAVVVIFDIERGAHSMWQPWLGREAFGQSLDKAEDAFIGALANKGRRLLAEKHPQVLIVGFVYMCFMLVELPLEADGQFLVGHVKAIIHQVAHRVTVDGANQITRLQSSPVRRTFRYHLTHPSIHFWHWSCSSWDIYLIRRGEGG